MSSSRHPARRPSKRCYVCDEAFETGRDGTPICDGCLSRHVPKETRRGRPIPRVMTSTTSGVEPLFSAAYWRRNLLQTDGRGSFAYFGRIEP